jgi:hypothetical protein
MGRTNAIPVTIVASTADSVPEGPASTGWSDRFSGQKYGNIANPTILCLRYHFATNARILRNVGSFTDLAFRIEL